MGATFWDATTTPIHLIFLGGKLFFLEAKKEVLVWLAVSKHVERLASCSQDSGEALQRNWLSKYY